VPAPDPFPFDRSHRERQVSPLGPLTDVLDQDHQRRLALAGAGTQMARRRQPGSAGRAHQDHVDAGQEVTRRLGPPAAGVGHEDDPAQVDTEVGRRHHAGIRQADRRAPAPRA
jgi:hypothetical protein